MSAWKPGDVARIRVGTGDWEFGLMREDGVWGCQHNGERRDWEEVQVRPLVVIDPEDGETVARLRDALGPVDSITAFINVQAALRSLIAPPKPNEPLGLGAVVEDADGHLHTHARNGLSEWVGSDGKWRTWNQISAVRVLSEGVQP